MDKIPQMLTSQQAADRLGVSRRRVMQLIKNGTLTAAKLGRDWLIAESSLPVALERPRRGWPKGKPRKADKESKTPASKKPAKRKTSSR